MEVAFSSNESNSQEKNKLRQALLDGMVKYGVISRDGEHLVVDVEALKNWSSRNEINGASRKLNQTDMVQLFSEMTGVPKGAQDSETDESILQQLIIVLPKSLLDMENKSDAGYASRSQKAMLQPWELGQKKKNWADPMILDSGEQTNLAEVAMTAVLHKLGAERNENGQLTIIHPQTGKRIPFSSSLIKDFVGINPSSSKGNNKNTFDSSPLQFTIKYLPHLLQSGLLRQSDFRTLGGSRSAEIANVHERRFNKTTGNVSFTNTSGQSAQYYVGKEKLVGIGMKIDHEHMTARMLDRQNVAIVKDEKGEKTIVATFPLLREEQLSKIQDAVKQQLLERGVDPTPTNVTSYTTIGGKQMKNLMREYSVTDFLKVRPGENPVDYYKRLKPLDNPDFVLKKVTGFFQQAGIGIHNLPWSEQLVLARALLVETDEQKLLEHAKKYGLSGVRAFLSMDLDASLGQKIVKIGEGLNPQLGDALFKKYGEIVDAAYQAADYIREHFPAQDELKNQSSQKLTEQLLKKGKDLLAEFAASSGQKGSEFESIKLVQKLEQLKTEVLMFAASYKILPKDAKVEFEDIANTSIEDRDSASLTEEEKKQMTEIFTLNRLGNYPEKLLKQTQKDFAETLNTPGHTFRMLVHQGRLVAFLHYDRISENEIYVGSLNLHPSAKDSPIAIAMLKAALEEKGGENKLKAIVWQKNPAGRFYKMLGFKETGQIENYENTGELYLQLERPPSQGTQIHEIKKAA